MLRIDGIKERRSGEILRSSTNGHREWKEEQTEWFPSRTMQYSFYEWFYRECVIGTVWLWWTEWIERIAVDHRKHEINIAGKSDD